LGCYNFVAVQLRFERSVLTDAGQWTEIEANGNTQFVAQSALIGGERTTAEVAGKGKVGA
jgi:hypothetical protein